MTRFHSVTVRMAKRQNLSLNPAKISGMCGRLMCCLAHEVDQYPSPKRSSRS
jgi:cell fate regulator YaaT (PSP1 superfamily)